MIAERRGRLDRAIAELVGDNKAMVREFRAVVLEIHRHLEESVAERNIAIREICSNFGITGIRYCRLSGKIRGGSDVDHLPAFDEMADFARANFPHVLARRRTESGTGSAEEQLVELIKEGVQPLPKPWDDAVLQQAISYVGPGWFEGFQSEEPEGFSIPRLTNTGVHYRIRGPIQRLAARAWSRIMDGEPAPASTIDAIERRLAKLSERDRNIVEGLIEWPKLREQPSPA